MVVSSPLELYTVYLGWRQYDVIWQACIQFGLAWVPFLGLFYENMTVPFESEFGNGTETSFRRVVIEMILMCLVIMICVYPWLPLNTTDVSYKPACASGAQQATVGHSGTTYDNTFGAMTSAQVKVPGLYLLIMDWASGFTNALIAGTIPCTPNIAGLMQQVNTANLSPDLKKQISAFNSVCYLKARSNFDSQQPEANTYTSTLKAAGGESDLNWMGSHVLQQLYYNNIYVQQPVPGFPYNEYPSSYVDDAVQNGQMQQPQWGYPSCQQWWSDPNHGIENRIVKEVNAQTPKNSYLDQMPVSDQVSLWITKKIQNTPYNVGSDVTANDVITRGILYNTDQNFGGFTTEQADVNTDSGISGAMAKPFMVLGQTMKEFTDTPFKRDALSDTLPIMQSVTLFLVILFMPLIQIFGRYKLSVCVSLCFILLSLIFLNYVWAMLNFFESALTDSTFNPFSGGWSLQHATLTNFMTALYIGAPLLFLGLMTMAGIKIGAGINTMIQNSAGFADGAAQSGKEAVSKTVGAAAKIASKVIRS